MTINTMQVFNQPDTTTNRTILKMDAKTFQSDFMMIAIDEISNDFSNDETFTINDQNKDVINQLYYYLTGNAEFFRGNLKKGIILIGGYGTGKTTIMKIVARLVMKHGGKVFKFISCVDLPSLVQHHGMEYFGRRPLILDEIGREPKVVKDYGTPRELIPELISMRYNTHGWTMATSNFSLEDLGEMYSGYIKDRMLEMFNFIELKGKSFRK